MKASEAREITDAYKMPLDAVYTSINVMAKAGHSYATFEIEKISEPISWKQILEADGYKVRVTDMSFCVEW